MLFIATVSFRYNICCLLLCKQSYISGTHLQCATHVLLSNMFFQLSEIYLCANVDYKDRLLLVQRLAFLLGCDDILLAGTTTQSST